VSEFRRRYLGELPSRCKRTLPRLENLNTQLRMTTTIRSRGERRDSLTGLLARPPRLTGLRSAPDRHRAGRALNRLRQELASARARYMEEHPTWSGSKRAAARSAAAEPSGGGQAPPRALKSLCHAAPGDLSATTAKVLKPKSSACGPDSRYQTRPRHAQARAGVPGVRGLRDDEARPSETRYRASRQASTPARAPSRGEARRAAQRSWPGSGTGPPVQGPETVALCLCFHARRAAAASTVPAT